MVSLRRQHPTSSQLLLASSVSYQPEFWCNVLCEKGGNQCFFEHLKINLWWATAKFKLELRQGGISQMIFEFQFSQVEFDPRDQSLNCSLKVILVIWQLQSINCMHWISHHVLKGQKIYRVNSNDSNKEGYGVSLNETP